MNIQTEIRMMLADSNKSQAELARLLGTTPANFNNKFQKANFRMSELYDIADVLGYDCDIKFKKRSK